jgi:hypothetical protein
MIDRKPRSYPARGAVAATSVTGTIQYRGAGKLRLPGSGAVQPVLISGAPHDGVSQSAAAAGEACRSDDLPNPRWLDRLIKLVAVLASAGLAGAVFTRVIFPMLPPLMKAEYGPSKSTTNIDNVQTAGSSEKFASRWLGDVQRQLKTASISSNSGAPRTGLGSEETVSPRTPLWRPSSEPKKIRTIRIRSDGSVSVQTDSSTMAGPYNTTGTVVSLPNGSVDAPPVGSESLSPAPDGNTTTSPPSRFPVVTGNAQGISGRAYAVQVASERSAAEAHASFRTLQAKFPNQLGGREPIVSRTDLGADGVHYRAMVGPFSSMEEATGVCSSLKAAGGNCHVERD